MIWWKQRGGCAAAVSDIPLLGNQVRLPAVARRLQGAPLKSSEQRRRDGARYEHGHQGDFGEGARAAVDDAHEPGADEAEAVAACGADPGDQRTPSGDDLMGGAIV